MNHLQDAMRVAHKNIWPLVRGQFGGCLESHLATGNDGTERPMATLQKSSTFINHWSPGYELYVNIMPLFYTSIYQSLYIGVCVYIKYLYIYIYMCVCLSFLATSFRRLISSAACLDTPYSPSAHILHLIHIIINMSV